MTIKNYSFGLLFLFLFIFIAGNDLDNKPGKTANTTEERNTMTERLDQFIKNEQKLSGAIAGVSIRSADNGKLLYENIGDVRLSPASNMKLLTAAAALETLGEEYIFPTEILVNGKVKNGDLKGDLYIKGKGDPTLLPADLENFAAKIKEKGITKIEGDIVGDDTWYDDIRLSPDLIWSDEHWYYGAQISALTVSPNKDYDAGTVIVEVKPSEKGEEPTVTISPETDYIEIKNKAQTVAGGSEEDLELRRLHGTNTILIEGTIPAGASHVKEWMAVWEPTGYVMNLFDEALKEQGITWTGQVRTGTAPEKSEVLFTHESMPLSELMIPFMKLSNNTHAEVLVKEMGKVVHGEGSWEKGLEVVEKQLKKLGMNTDTLMIRDGSGISHINLLPPNEISNLLFKVQNEKWFETYKNSLPIAGKEDRFVGGTLRHRMEGMEVYAKTGTIYGVSTLSGYVKAENGERVIFSIMLNNLLDEDDGPAIEDQLVKIIAQSYEQVMK
ncbi:D-alanyl-D-alanine carboxypeptidase/D-alanyl-D-alanine-endopeptidase [Virgibacillus kekensis]|uniref:D-alanyl-D-alanine carboxypeptidase/D-alanyl-D-alanine-endopeptidase n=1 Tax=Virgibacillus kekensis TaxID=202261 RepID=A0ABV9DF28_9BACI